MPSLFKLLLPVCLVAVSTAPLYAQSEPELRDFFEGKSVVVKLDMPATQEGIDVFPDARRAIDFAAYSARLKATGIAIRNGDSVLVTRVRVKEKLIEFQLAGGGFGTFGDDTRPASTRRRHPRASGRRTSSGWSRTRPIATGSASWSGSWTTCATGGSAKTAATRPPRWPPKKPRRPASRLPGCTADRASTSATTKGFRAASGPTASCAPCAEYVDFPFAQDRRPAAGDRVTAQPAPRDPAPGGGAIRKGMSMAEVEQSLGRPDKESLRNEGSLKVVTATYTRGDQVITVDYVEGVLIKYAISSKVARREGATCEAGIIEK